MVVEDQSITTAGKQKLVIDRKELEKMNGKRVLVVDDVISTGGSLKHWTRWQKRPSALSWVRPLFWPRATLLSARISSSLSAAPVLPLSRDAPPLCAFCAE